MSRYRELGVDVRKPGVETFRGVVDDLFPGAFCVVQRDPSSRRNGMVLHTDSAGSKPIQAYLVYRETGDPLWFRGLAQDALAMNINDVVCVGAKPVSFIDYVAFNTLLMDRVMLLGALADGFGGCKEVLDSEGVQVSFGGGETADLPDVLRTLDVSVTVMGRAPLASVITGEAVKPGDVIIGLRSGGGVRYEKGANSGIMSNGHTLARTSLLSSDYLAKYPEISHPGGGRYRGRFSLFDQPEGLGQTIGEAFLSPTRLYAPIALAILKKIGTGVHGMVHNTGGGQTKCLRVGRGLRYVKDSLPEPDPIFRLIQAESGVEWREMYQDFNMGVGFEATLDPTTADEALSIAEGFGIGAEVIGRIERGGGEGNSLQIITPRGKLSYP